ncbi:DUF2199 domain-containing protein [Streptomyces sp. NPDC001941]|uniref:DUF2199 domain-containing protein n=1 Tax=Streptomyces sp. NPDC001941 TaxID=3154659 RepID=UPI0033234044
MTAHLPTCSCCGDPLDDSRRIDVGFNLPDAALGVPEEARHHLSVRALLRVDGAGCFIRCLLSVRLTHDTELVLGMWLEVDEATLRRADELWEAPGYAGFAFRGRIANVIRPWGEDVLGAEVTARVADVDELPYLVTGHSPAAARLLEEVWDRDHVLSRFPMPLPVDVRTSLDDGWWVVRTAGLNAYFEDGYDHFAGPDRSAAVNLMRDDVPGRAPADFLAVLLDGAPDKLPAQRLTETVPGGLRYAFWLTPADHGRPRHELYGFTVAAGSGNGSGSDAGSPLASAAGVFCTFEDAAELAWAQTVWRSLEYDPRAAP